MAIKGIGMSNFKPLALTLSGILALSFTSALQASQLRWDGGPIQWTFSAEPYEQREPKLTQEQAQGLNKAIELIKQNRFSDAISELKLQLNRQPNAAMWYALAQLQQQQKQPKDAVTSLRSAIELLPQFTRAHESLGILLSQQKNYKDARPHLQLAASHGGNAQIYGLLGYGYLQSGQPQAAKAAYNHALLLAGDNSQWKRGLLHAAIAANEQPLASSLVEQLLVNHPTDRELYYLRANLAQRQQQWELAISSLEIAHKLKPENALRWQLAQLYLNQGHFESAQPHLQQLLQNGINGREQALLQMVEYLLGQQQHNLAQTILTPLLASKRLNDFEHSQALTNQAQLLFQSKANSQSQQISTLNHALRLDPVNGRALLDLAQLYENGEPLQAEALYQRASALPSVQLEALQRHAQLLLKQQAYQRAELLLQQAVKIAPDDRRLRDNLATVSRMVQAQG